MSVRFLAAVSAALLAGAVAPGPAMAATTNHVPLKGTIWTTSAEPTGPPALCEIEGQPGVVLTVIESGVFNSTLTHVGLVTLVQHQCVAPTELQFPGGPPKQGLIRVEDATITAANGDTLTFTTPVVRFETFEPAGIDPSAGPLPIAFSGELDITGGTGRFAAADGSAQFEGMFCFRVNGGRYTLAGMLSR
jgi:hypothetical protein